MRFRRFVFATRGLYLLAAQGVILWLKVRAGVRASLTLYASMLVLVLAAQVLRVWAAGFVGTTARGRETHAAAMLTAGPYAYVRNPMYLGNLVLTTGLALMSGLWWAPLLAWATYVFVYAAVIPHEETYLTEKFGEEYRAYALAVPRLVPTWQRYPHRTGVFSLRNALANEIATSIGILLFAILYFPGVAA